jgi:hypothetical protein
MELYKQDQFVTMGEIPSVMASIGITKGFSRATINRKIRQGLFDVPFIISGGTKLFRPTQIVSWWNGLPRHRYVDGKLQQIK